VRSDEASGNVVGVGLAAEELKAGEVVGVLSHVDCVRHASPGESARATAGMESYVEKESASEFRSAGVSERTERLVQPGVELWSCHWHRRSISFSSSTTTTA